MEKLTHLTLLPLERKTRLKERKREGKLNLKGSGGRCSFVLSQVQDKEKKPYVLISNRTSNLRISRSNALPLSYRDSTTSYATTSLCDTHSAYTFDKQCRNRLMCERTKTETTRINIVLSHFAQLKI